MIEQQVYNESDLSNFTGTNYYHLDYLNIKLTDGVAFVRDNFKAGWLISDISSIYFYDVKVKEHQDFLIVTLKINLDSTALLTFQADSDKPILYKQKYQYTDISDYFKGEEIKFYLIDGVLLLPSEY
jgi:chaperone required for assembly of F1-ATPase